MTKTTARKATKSLHKGKKLEQQTTLSKGKQTQYLQYNLSNAYVTGYSISSGS